MNKNLKNVSGGILLEVLLMLAILMVVFPIMQKDIKKRTDNIRNQMVIKDLMKLKGATETYLKKNPTFEENKVFDIDFKVLVESGLPSTFNKTNVLGQDYKVRIKTKNTSDGMSYDAIIIAMGGNVPSLRIRDVVKEARGYAGYVEGNMIYAPNWQLDVTSWNNSNLATIDDSSIVVKTGFSRKEYKYISRIEGVGSSTMRTDLFLNLQNIDNVNNLYIGDSLEVLNMIAKGNVSISNLAVEERMILNNDMNINNEFNFSSGLNDTNIVYEDETTESFLLGGDLSIAGVLRFLSTSNFNYLRDIVTTKVQFDGGVKLSIGNLLSFYSTAQSVVNVANLSLNSFTNQKNTSSAYGLIFKSIKVKDNTVLSLSSQTGVNIHDLIVHEVNNKLLCKGNSCDDSIKIGGIDVSARTPISVILRALNYYYANVYQLVYNNYPDELIPGWYYNLRFRCEYQECSSGWYH